MAGFDTTRAGYIRFHSLPGKDVPAVQSGFALQVSRSTNLYVCAIEL